MYTVSQIDATASGNRVMKIQSIYERLRTVWNPFRAIGLKCYEYVVGNQIDDDIREQLRREQRPALVFDLIQPKVITIAGLLESNKMYMRAIPVGDDDNQTADLHTRLVSDWAMRNCNGINEITKAALDAAIGGIGWLNNYWSTKEDEQGRWYTESYDPFMVLFDADARRKDQKDWRYEMATGFYTADEIISMWADKLDDATIAEIRLNDDRISGVKKEATPVSWYERIWSGVQDFFTRATLTKKSSNYEGGQINDYVDTRMGRYRLIEFHDKRTKVRTIFYNTQTREAKEMDGGESNTPDQEQEMAALQLQVLNQVMGGGWIKKTFVTQELWITTVVPTLLPGRPLFEQPYPVQGRGFQFKPIFCYDLHPDITKMQSIIAILLDPQDSYNQRRMSFLEWIMDAVNPSWMAPTASIAPADLETWKSKERGKINLYTPQQGAQPERLHPLAEATSLKVFAEEDRDLAESLTNVTPNTQGREETGSESGILFAYKVQRALTALSYFFGNVQFAMKEVFNYCDANLQKFMDAPRKIRLLSSKNVPEYITVNMPTLMGVFNDVTQGEFDFEPDTQQLGETARQVKFAEMLALVRVAPPELVKWDEVFRMSDLPVADIMADFAAQMMGLALQAQMMNAKQQQQQNQIDNTKGGAEAVSAMDSAAGTSPEQQATQRDQQLKAGELGMKGRSMIPTGMA